MSLVRLQECCVWCGSHTYLYLSSYDDVSVNIFYAHSG